MVFYVLVILALFAAISIYYVYRIRGNVRFSGLKEYLRKGWPVFAPLNTLLYLSTKSEARQAFVSPDLFDNLHLLEDNWADIAREAEALYRDGFFEQTTKRNTPGFYDVGFRTFFKYGWSKFYCTWYGTTLTSAATHCPKTIAVLEKIPSINGAMFTLLPPHSVLTRHLDPVACSLRYHLGLRTPNSSDCFISVDGKQRAWHDGKAFVFDETYLHFVENNTDQMRLILMCDLERPMGRLGHAFNVCFKWLVSKTLVPNLPEDKAGSLSLLFSKVAPILAQAKQLKKQHPGYYYPLKWVFNTILSALLLLTVALVLSAPSMLLK